jgi:ABC-2 type transport system ATP-binding protein
MLRVTRVTRRYDRQLALDAVTLEIAPGEIVGLLGANGAGKSTLLRIIAGVQPPDDGTIEVAGHDLALAPVEARSRLGYSPEEPSFYDELSAAEHLIFVAGVRGLAPREAAARAAQILQALALDGRAHEPVRHFSHGMRKKLSFAAAVLHRPAVLLCDEALEGFDAPAALAAKDELRARAREGCSVLFSSHVTETMERLCDRVLILDRGRLQRTLDRHDWGAPAVERSALESEFLALIESRGGPTRPPATSSQGDSR